MNCPNCGKKNDEGKMFCGGCGEELPAIGAASAVASTPAATPVLDPLAAANATFAAHVQTGSGQLASIVLPADADVLFAMSWVPGEDGIDGVTLPLTEGAQFQIHRQASTKAVADIPALAIPGNTVSSSPIVGVVRNGKIYVRDTGSSNGFFIAKLVKVNDGEVELDPAKGEHLITPELITFE